MTGNRTTVRPRMYELEERSVLHVQPFHRVMMLVEAPVMDAEYYEFDHLVCLKLHEESIDDIETPKGYEFHGSRVEESVRFVLERSNRRIASKHVRSCNAPPTM